MNETGIFLKFINKHVNNFYSHNSTDLFLNIIYSVEMTTPYTTGVSGSGVRQGYTTTTTEYYTQPTTTTTYAVGAPTTTTYVGAPTTTSYVSGGSVYGGSAGYVTGGGTTYVTQAPVTTGYTTTGYTTGYTSGVVGGVVAGGQKVVA